MGLNSQVAKEAKQLSCKMSLTFAWQKGLKSCQAKGEMSGIYFTIYCYE